jgi:hypothetical protein
VEQAHQHDFAFAHNKGQRLLPTTRVFKRLSRLITDDCADLTEGERRATQEIEEREKRKEAIG